MTEFELWRYSSDNDSTLGWLMLRGRTTWRQLCFTLEDDHDPVKTVGETRVPAGKYTLGFRTNSPMARRYEDLFPAMQTRERGMIWLLDVPNYRYVYVHVGNDEDDTAGCVLVGLGRNETTRTIQQSRSAYKLVYPELAAAIELGPTTLTIRDLDRLPAPPGLH